MRLRPLLVAAFVAFASSSAVCQDPPVNAPFALAALVTRQGQLAVSGDGRWRVHVDAANQLHRVGTADHVESGHVALPLLINTLALTRDGGRAALLSRRGCLAIIDFAPMASMRWVVVDAQGIHWSNAPPAACSVPETDAEQPDQHFGLRVLALSDDGRLVATRTGVIDLESRRIVARLPQVTVTESTPATVPTQLHFLDGGKRLLALLAGLQPPEDHYDVYHAALLQAAVWDLGTRRLLRLIDIPTSADAGLGLATSVDLASGDVWSVAADPRGGEKPALLRTPIADCHGRPQRVQAIDAGVREWTGDPHHRWVAQLEWDGDLGGGRTNAGLTLRVNAIGGATLLRADFDRDIKMVASPDGSTIVGLRMPPPSKAWPPVAPFGGDVLEWHLAGLARPTVSQLGAWSAQACADPTESSGAREVVLQTRTMDARWERRVALIQARRDSVDAATANGRCSESLPVGTSAASFVRTDGTLWLDLFDRYEQIDPATGLALVQEATVRKAGTCARPVPAVNGSVAWAGDTLSLRSFGTGTRRPIDVRPGWQVALVAIDAGQVRVRWIQKVAKAVAASASEDGELDLPFHDVVYDMQGWRVVSDDAGRDDPQSDGPPSALSYEDQGPGTCRALDGRTRRGWDIEIASDDVLESLRGVACDPAKQDGIGQTTMRLGVDLEPGNALSTVGNRTAIATGGSIGVVMEGKLLRVFDISRRLELGRIPLAGADMPPSVHVLAERGWIIVDELATHHGTTEHVVRGIEIPR